MQTFVAAGAVLLGIFGCLGNRFAEGVSQTLVAMLTAMLAAYRLGLHLLHGAAQVTFLCALAGAAVLLCGIARSRLGALMATLGGCLLCSALFLGSFGLWHWAALPALLCWFPATVSAKRYRRLAGAALCSMPVVVGAFELLAPIHRQSLLFAAEPLSPTLCSYLLLCLAAVTVCGRWFSCAFVTRGAHGI